MSNSSSLIQRDLKHIWHPCSQMKDFEQFPPFVVQRAKGSYLYTEKGPLIDGISSWWCKSLGHGHPAVIEAIQEQLNCFEHVIAANTTHPKFVELAEKLATISGKQHSFFASDGSCAVEIAMKLCLHAHRLKGHPERRDFVTLENCYHGETLGALSVSDLGEYKDPSTAFGLTCHTLCSIPYVNNQHDPLWSNCEPLWPAILKQLEKHRETTAAIIIEPIVQGSGGMRCYSADFLNRLDQFAKANDIYLIADEIMTGLGRTGKWLAGEYSMIDPDIICLSKGITSGSLPFSCALIDHEIYDLFYNDYDTGHSFLHSHTHSGNALAVSAALATLQVMEKEGINEQAIKLGEQMRLAFSEIASATGQLGPVRHCGAIVAADLNPHPSEPRVGYKISQEALKHGALLRPIGNTLYWFPPLTTDTKTIGQLAEITLQSINTVYKM